MPSTHPHADFVAGHAELFARSDAPILISNKAPTTFVHRDLKDGDKVTLGTVEIGRAVLRGTAGEYHHNCGLDQMFFGFKGLDVGTHLGG